MANLAAGVQRIGVYIGSTPFNCNGSVFAVGTTKVSTLNSSGNPIAWRNGNSFNNFPGASKDQIAPYTSIIVNPSTAIVTNDTLFSFGTPINTGSGNTGGGSGFSSGFGA